MKTPKPIHNQSARALPKDWREYKLEHFVTIYNEFRIPLSKMERAKKQGRYPYYGASGVIDYLDDYLFDGEYVLISEDGENLKSRQTPIAFKASGRFWVNNHAHIVKGKKDFYNNLMMYYFKNLDLNSFITGAVQPKLNKANLLSIPIILPEKEEKQKVITEVLSSLDDKIDLLHRQNKTLEDMAQTLFRQRFIEEADESWEELAVSDIAEHLKINVKPAQNPTNIYYHYSLPAYDNSQMPNAELGESILSNKYEIVPNSILISKLNPRFPRIWAIGDKVKNNSICSTEFQVFKPIKNKMFGFLFFLFKSDNAKNKLKMSASGTSGSHQRVRPEDILNISFRISSEIQAQEFSKLINPNIEKLLENKNQINTLENLRNILLPKLMSGEVRIK